MSGNPLTILKAFFDLGFNIFPVKQDKTPLLGQHGTWQRKWSLSEVPKEKTNIAVAAGRWSDGLFCIDVDTKYDLTGELFKRLMSDLAFVVGQDVIDSLVIQQTVSGGYHLIFKTDLNIGNIKLAFRPATETELQENPKAKKKCLLETRGDGGYFLVFPSKGYRVIQGKFSSIPRLDDTTVQAILQVCRSFNQVPDEDRSMSRGERVSRSGKTPWEDYNERGDVIGLLQKHGWSVVFDKGGKTYLKHPQATSSTSGNYSHDIRILYVFSPNTALPPDRGLNPFTVYCELECNGDVKEASRRLLEEGYGEKNTRIEKRIKQERLQEKQDADSEELVDLFIDSQELREQTNRALDEKIEHGIGIGIPEIDRHLLHKRGDLCMLNGFESTGKSTFGWWWFVQLVKKHGLRIVMATKENENTDVRIRLMEFYLKKYRTEWEPYERSQAQNFVDAHFRFIRQDVSHSFLQLLEAAEKYSKDWPFDILVADPYNAFPKKGFGNKHDYDQEVINETRIWKRRNRIAVWVIIHPQTGAGRENKTENKAPTQYDVEGGSKWANACDTFCSWHRDTQSDDGGKIGELFIRKIRVRETGGQPTPRNAPILLKFTGVDYVVIEREGFSPTGNNFQLKEDYKQNQFKDDSDPLGFMDADRPTEDAF